MNRPYVTETVFDCCRIHEKLWTTWVICPVRAKVESGNVRTPQCVQQRGKAEIRVISDPSPARIWINELNEESTKTEASGKKIGPHRLHSTSKSVGPVSPAKKQGKLAVISILVHGDGDALLSAVRPTNHENPATNLERLINEGIVVEELADTSHHNWSAEVSELQFMDCYKGFSV